ncbi:MAG: c-type cytochrome [bacterium]
MSKLEIRMKSIFLIAIMTTLFGCKSGPPPHITDPGQIIYLGYKDTFASCKRCHGDDGEGSQQGPDIRKVIEELGRKEVRKIIVFGKESNDYKEDMPALGEDLSPEEIGYVLDFITHWGKVDSTAAGSQ